jgi:hypothetical protein
MQSSSKRSIDLFRRGRFYTAPGIILLDKALSMLIISSNLSKRRLSGRKEEDSNSCDRSYIASLRVYIFRPRSGISPLFCLERLLKQTDKSSLPRPVHNGKNDLPISPLEVLFECLLEQCSDFMAIVPERSTTPYPKDDGTWP